MDQMTIELSPLTDICDSLINKLKKQEGGPELSLKTLPTLSQKIFGFTKGRMYVIGGRTSQGKTTLALQIAMDLAKQGKKVYFLSFEMDEEELMLRMLSNMCEIDSNELRFNVSKHEKMITKIRDYFDKPTNFPLLLTYNVGLTTKDLNSIIEDLPNPDMVIVDYVQAIRKIDLDKLTSMNNYIIEFRRLCVEHNFCGILVSQINRAAMDETSKQPHLWQLKGSGTIEEHADLVMLIHWNYFYTNKLEDKNKFSICVAKNRQGNTVMVDVDYIPEFYKLRDIGDAIKPTPEEKQKMAESKLSKAALKTFGGSIVD